MALGQGAYLISGLTLVSATWNRRMRFIEDLPAGQTGTAEPLPLLLLEVVPLSDSGLFELRPGEPVGNKRQYSLTEDPVR